MKYPEPKNPDEHWGREALAMGLGLSTMGIGLVASQLAKKPEVAIGGAAIALALVAYAWPRGGRR